MEKKKHLPKEVFSDVTWQGGRLERNEAGVELSPPPAFLAESAATQKQLMCFQQN